MVDRFVFGTTKHGETVTAFRLSNRNGMSVTVLDYGCTLQSVCVPHRGTLVDVCLGYDTAADYEENDAYVGAVIGRYAGRIPDGRIILGETTYRLAQNDGTNHLHGGLIGFDKRIFSASVTDHSVCFTYRSHDDEEGYPSSLSVSAMYMLTEDNALRLVLRGIADGLTVWNPTSHAYWNLNGHNSGNALDHLLTIPSETYVPVDAQLIPIGIEAPVSGTPFDYRTPHAIHERFEKTDGGYDHSFVLSDNPIELCGNNGIRMQILTDCRTVQLYTSNFLATRRGKNGATYAPHQAICLETESRPMMRNAPIPEESILLPNTVKTHTTVFRFFT